MKLSQHKASVNQKNGNKPVEVPDPEVTSQAKRRQFSAKYKLQILEEVDQCDQPG